RSLKLWMILRSFGASGLRDHLQRHIEIANRLAQWVDSHPDFERLAPAPFSVVCFRWRPAGTALSEHALDAANTRLIDMVNRSGEVFISHTLIRGHLAIRIAVGHLSTTEAHVQRAWDLLTSAARAIST